MYENIETDTIQITNGCKVTTPSSILFLTPYVLMEQQDWFEDEILFVRKFVKEGMSIIDIGANYGLYTLSMAHELGKNGKIWAFEPTSYVAQCLSQSIINNKFTTVELIQSGLSDHTGYAKLYCNPNPEHNSINPLEDMPNTTFETVPLQTLDRFAANNSIQRIDFIKLDAEGEEANIIEGARDTLAKMSPLIMYEFKHNDVSHNNLIEVFETLGYTSYYLIPSLDLLVPFEKKGFIDTFVLNLFCCKDDTAQRLHEDGLLLNHPHPECPNPEERCDEKDRWLLDLESKVFSADFRSLWKSIKTKEDDPTWLRYKEVLTAYALSQKNTLSVFERFHYLKRAFFLGMHCIQEKETFPRCMTVVRIALDIGQRTYAVTLLTKLIGDFSLANLDQIGEPFYPVCKRFDEIPPMDRVKDWVMASILEQYEKSRAFSSYFTGQKSLSVLKKLQSLGFQSEEMKRRLMLIKSRFALGCTYSKPVK